MTHTPGTITATYYHTPTAAIIRPLIIWDSAYEGDESRWLVQWATSDMDAAATAGYRAAHKPHGAAFILHHIDGTNWESESASEPGAGHFGDAGIIAIGQYEPADEAANSVRIMVDLALSQATEGAEDSL